MVQNKTLAAGVTQALGRIRKRSSREFNGTVAEAPARLEPAERRERQNYYRRKASRCGILVRPTYSGRTTVEGPSRTWEEVVRP